MGPKRHRQPLQDQRNITSRSLRNREDIRKKREEQLLAEQQKAPPEVNKTVQRKSTVVTSRTVQRSAPKGKARPARKKSAAKAPQFKQDPAQDRKTKPTQKTCQSRSKGDRPEKAFSAADAEAEAEDASLVGSDLRGEYVCELLKEVKILWNNVKALSTATPDFRVIGIGAEGLLKKILYKGFVPSEEVVRNLNISPMSGRSTPAANTITTVDEGLDQLNRMISETDGLMSSNPSGNKKTPWSRLSDNLKRKVLQNHCINLNSKENIEDDDIFEQAGINIDSTNHTESEWQADLQKCGVGSEQTFQCTIMIQAINRHRFLGFQTTLDYSIGQEWHNTFLPKLYIAKPNPSYDHISLPAPHPDLCVGFSPKKFFANYEVEQFEIPRHLMDHLIPEKIGATGDPSRVFPFLMMEVKGSASDVGGSRATHQSLNDAAHAPYNMWQFMRVTPKLEQKFFESFMVFTAGGHGKEFWIKIHRPMRLETQGCPMAFQYRHILVTESKPYSQEVVTLYLKRVMVWGIRALLPHLRSAVNYVRQESRGQLDSSRDAPALSRTKSVDSSRRGGGSSTCSKRGNSSVRQTGKRKQRTDSGETMVDRASHSFSITGAAQGLEDSTIDDGLRQGGKGNKQRKKRGR